MSATHACLRPAGSRAQGNSPAVMPAHTALGYVAARHEDVIRAMLPACSVTVIENADPVVSLRLCAAVTNGGLFGTHRARRGRAVYATGGVRNGADLELELRGVSDPREPIGIDLDEISADLDRTTIESLFRRCDAFDDVARSPLSVVVLGNAIVNRYLDAHGSLHTLLSVCAAAAQKYACAVVIECPALPGVSVPAAYVSAENAPPILRDPNLAALARVAVADTATPASRLRGKRQILHVAWTIHCAETPGCYRSPSSFVCYLNDNSIPERWPWEHRRRFVYDVRELSAPAELDKSEFFGVGAKIVLLDNSSQYDKRTFVRRFLDRF